MSAAKTQLDTTVPTPIAEIAPEPGLIGPLLKPDWHADVRLQPHHFQAQDRYHEDLVRHALRMAFDDGWGVWDLAIDEEALAAGQFAVRRLRAIFPDGTPVIAGAAGSETIPPRYFDPKLRGRPTLDVFIGLPLERPGAGMVESAPAPGSHARYVQEQIEVTDYNTGRRPVAMAYARPNLRILFEDEARDACSLLRVARLQQAQGRVQLDPAFVPPALRVRASPALERCLRSMEQSAVTTVAALGEVRVHATEMTGADTARLLLAATLGRCLPALQAATASDSSHPRDAYRAAAELVGGIAAFSPTGRARVPSYEPLDLQTTFGGLEQSLREVLDTLSGPRQRSIPLEPFNGGFWRAELREPGIFGHDFLLIMTGGDPAALHASVPAAVKVAAWDEIGEIVQRHLAAVSLVPEIRRPRGLSLPPQAACFRIDKRSAAWAGIVKHGSLALCLPAGFAQCRPMLLVQEPNLLTGCA